MSSVDKIKCPVSPGDVVAGKYKVERVLGAGGMGVVVAARHLDLDQPVALKFILPQALAGKGNIERFMREARAAVRLKSEHVARVYDVGRDKDENPFMVLELLEGMDLAKLAKQKGPLPVADTVEYLLQACEALVEAHAAGIVHRDLKPQNLFVTRRLNGTALVKVLDFGIAKAIGPGAEGQMSLTDSAAIIGSPLYMAPETMRSARTAEVRSDIWALGVMLFELLGGQLPFEGETVTEVCIRVVNEAPPDLLALRPGLDPQLIAIVMKCLEKEPDARFRNVAALAGALEPFSRSAKQGGPVRPWRSFEDTVDSANGNPFAGASAEVAAEDTGPATLVTMETGPPVPRPLLLAEDEKRARAIAGSTKASPGAQSGPSGTGPTGPQQPHTQPLVSTGQAWVESTGNRTKPPPARSFSTGVVVAIVGAAAIAAAGVGVFFGRSARQEAAAAAAASVATSAPAAVVAPPPPPATVAPPVPTTIAADPPASAAASGERAAARLLSAGKTPRLKAPAPVPSVAPAVVSPKPEVKPEGTISPNGAPILH